VSEPMPEAELVQAEQYFQRWNLPMGLWLVAEVRRLQAAAHCECCGAPLLTHCGVCDNDL
jgi:hypothetical protein